MRRHIRQPRDERGAALVLAILFMVVVGAVGGGVVASISSGIHDGAALAQARNREYAADAAIETSIARVRLQTANNATTCGSPQGYTFENNPQVLIHVDCANTPAVVAQSDGTLVAQNNVIFTACLQSGPSPGATCNTVTGPTGNGTIITADVSFPGSGSAVTTHVLSWSVNG